MKTSVELREERAALVKQARELTDKAKTEERDLSDEENAQYDLIMDDVDKMKARIDRMERLETAESDLDAPTPRVSDPIDVEHARSSRRLSWPPRKRPRKSWPPIAIGCDPARSGPTCAPSIHGFDEPSSAIRSSAPMPRAAT